MNDRTHSAMKVTQSTGMGLENEAVQAIPNATWFGATDVTGRGQSCPD